MNVGGVCRTAVATPGLLITGSVVSSTILKMLNFKKYVILLPKQYIFKMLSYSLIKKFKKYCLVTLNIRLKMSGKAFSLINSSFIKKTLTSEHITGIFNWTKIIHSVCSIRTYLCLIYYVFCSIFKT